MFLERAVTVTCRVCDYRYSCRPVCASVGMRGRGVGTDENVIRLTPVKCTAFLTPKITEITNARQYYVHRIREKSQSLDFSWPLPDCVQNGRKKNHE